MTIVFQKEDDDWGTESDWEIENVIKLINSTVLLYCRGPFIVRNNSGSCKWSSALYFILQGMLN